MNKKQYTKFKDLKIRLALLDELLKNKAPETYKKLDIYYKYMIELKKEIKKTSYIKDSTIKGMNQTIKIINEMIEKDLLK